MKSSTHWQSTPARMQGRSHFAAMMVGGMLVGAGFFLGSAQGGSGGAGAAHADSQPAVQQFVQRVAPPVIAIPERGAAIVGAADDRYYFVRSDGSTLILQSDHRSDLLWRDHRDR